MDRNSFEDLKKRGAFDEPQEDAFLSFGFYSVPDLTEEERTPPEFIVEGLVPVGMSFLSGAPKTRKSFLALQMGIAVASGNDFFGHTVHQSSVAYFDLEGSKSRISARSSLMSAEFPRNLYVTNNIKERLADGLTDKIRLLHQQRPDIRLVIIDTYSRARGIFHAAGANAYDADVRLLEPVQRMALDEGIALLFVHHHRKGAALAGDSFEMLSGTMGISGSADAVLNLVADGKRFDGKAVLEYTPRDARGGELNLTFDETRCEWLAETKPSLMGNPVLSWIVQHTPERGREGRFFPYEEVAAGAYHCAVDGSAERVISAVRGSKIDLFTTYGVGVQLGVKSNGKRGVRIICLS